MLSWVTHLVIVIVRVLVVRVYVGITDVVVATTAHHLRHFHECHDIHLSLCGA